MTKVKRQRKSEGSKTFSSDKRHRSVNLNVRGEVTFAVVKSLIDCLNEEFCRVFGPDSYSFRWLDRREGGIQVVRSPHEELTVKGAEEDRCSKQVRFPMFDQEWDESTVIEPMKWERIVFRASGCVWRMDEYILFMACMIYTFPGFEQLEEDAEVEAEAEAEAEMGAREGDNRKKRKRVSISKGSSSSSKGKKKSKPKTLALLKGKEIEEIVLQIKNREE